MDLQITNPQNKDHWLELRAKDLTSTEISALFNCNPYMTHFELWHRKKSGISAEFIENDRMKWGTRLQDAIAYGIAEEHGMTIRKMDEYISVPELRVGSSFDFSVGNEGILEIKNVDYLAFKSGWIELDSGEIEAPPHIELQVQHQMLVSNRKFAHIGALIGGNDVKVLFRDRDEEILAAIIKASSAFWKSIEDNVEPDPNMERDAEFISKLYNYAEPGKFLDATFDNRITELANQHRLLGEEIKYLEKKRDGIKSELIMIVDDVEKVKGNGFSISAGTVHVPEKIVNEYTYRMFKINWPRVKVNKI